MKTAALSKMKWRWAIALGLFFTGASAVPMPARAATLRHQVDQRGDFVLFGNTLARDCGAGVPNPVVGTNGACGSNTSDTGADVFWRSDDPGAGAAAANNTITVASARSTAVLNLPAGATVTYARLYWSSPRSGATNDTTATIERPGTLALTTVTADASVAVTSLNPVGTFYQSTANVTALLQTHGAGAYRVGGVDTVAFADLNSEISYAAWSMVVFYRLDSDPPRNLALFDGLDLINSGGPAVTVTLSGFLVPNAGFDAKLGVVTYEGDDQYDGDALSFNGVALSDAQNPSNDFFNGTRSHLGALVSNAGDLPRLTGATRSMGGFDLDVVDVRSRLSQGDTSATITASTNLDFYVLGAFVTSVSTFKPDFSGATKTVTNLTRGGSTTRPGDVIEYTVAATNTGNDPAVNVILNDPLPAGVTFVPGSIRVTAGPNTGTKTDGADSDQGEYIAASRTVRVRLGTGANGTTGGSLPINTSSTVAFRVTVNPTATGTIANQATITATGQSGAPPADYVSDGNGPAPGTPPTNVPVDDCLAHADCPAATPRCLTTPDPNICVGCLADSDCSGASPVCDATTRTCRGCAGNTDCPSSAPVCQAGGSCGQCSATNQTLCTGATPVCDVVTARCVGCLTSSTCAGTTPVCDPGTRTCVGCLTSASCSGSVPVCNQTTLTCRGCAGDNECGGATPACMPSGACGACSATNVASCPASAPLCNVVAGGVCVGCVTNAHCSGTTPVCNVGAGVCQGCSGDGQCGGTTPACQPSGACGACSSSNPGQCTGATPFCSAATGTCVGCRAASDCGGATPVCDATTRVCRGCTAASDCPAAGTQCETTSGRCVGCTSNGDCAGTTPVCDTTTRFCRGCSADGDCGAANPACQANGSCGQCSASTQALCTGSTPVCDVAGARCVQCLVSGTCPGTAPVCNPTNNTCVGCLSSANCAGATPVCSPATQTCVGCLSSADCAGTTPVCSPTTQTCVGCSANGPPSCPDPARPACHTAGPLAGACTECAAGDSSRCGGIKPQCLVAYGLCGCNNSDGDGECGAASSGVICNGTVGICVPGCGTGAGRNGCPAGQLCGNVGAAGTGTCQPNVCVTDGDCPAPFSRCDVAASPPRCVQCLNNIGCNMPLVCDVAGTKQCVECVPGQTAGCSIDLAGSRCLANNTCGCATDVECGAATSGRICDTTIGKCVAGCRAVSGNGCPTGSLCTSTGAAPGTCVSAGTGGAGGMNADGGIGGAGGSGATGGSGGSGGGGGGGTAGSTGGGGNAGSGGNANGSGGNGGGAGAVSGGGTGGGNVVDGSADSGGGMADGSVDATDSDGPDGSADGGRDATGGASDARDGAAGGGAGGRDGGLGGDASGGTTADARNDATDAMTGDGPSRPDAATGGDSAPPGAGGYIAGGGCACTTAGGGAPWSRASTIFAIASLLAFVIGARRRRRGSQPPR